MKILSEIEKIYLRNDLKEFNPGDTVKVHYRIIEGGKERIQIFQGTVIRIKGAGINKTFIVRKISFGIGVERIFPYHSPKVAKIEIIRRGKVRRAKLYYLRERVGKATKVKEKKYIKVDKLEKENPPEEDQPPAEKKIKTKVKEKKGKIKKTSPKEDQPLAEKSIKDSGKDEKHSAENQPVAEISPPKVDQPKDEKTSPKEDQPLAEKSIKDSGKDEKPLPENKPLAEKKKESKDNK